MKIAFDINGVLRDTFLKASQIYEKFYLEESVEDNTSSFDVDSGEWVEDTKKPFEYELNLPVESLDLINHFSFPSQDELYSFFYVDFPMQIFGHSPSIDFNTFNILNKIYEDLREDNEIYIISDEIGKTKPATLFFLSKYGCLVENISFYSQYTFNNVIDQFDLIVTSNPNILDYSKNTIKVETTYNNQCKSDYTISSIEFFDEVFEKFKLKQYDISIR